MLVFTRCLNRQCQKEKSYGNSEYCRNHSASEAVLVSNLDFGFNHGRHSSTSVAFIYKFRQKKRKGKRSKGPMRLLTFSKNRYNNLWFYMQSFWVKLTWHLIFLECPYRCDILTLIFFVQELIEKGKRRSIFLFLIYLWED